MKMLLVALALVSPQDWTPLFPEDGVPKGWIVRKWSDVSQPAPEGAVWKVDQGVLKGSDPRGTWIVSEKEYGDFVLEFEWKLGEQGNSGCGLRFPLKGDPAYDGIELQMVDPGYYNFQKVRDNELAGALYSALAPTKQVYKSGEWNTYEVTCKGPRITVVLNGQKVIDVNLDEQDQKTVWKDGKPGPSLKSRPRQGRIGFQELSRAGQVQIRNARIKVLE
jgi:hypothetical protein